jgi:hypothetical protein
MHLPTVIQETSNPDARRLALKAMAIESEMNGLILSRANCRVYRENPEQFGLDMASLQGKYDFYVGCLKTSHGETI